VVREEVPFAREGSQFTRDFEDLVGWLATTMDKTAVCRLVRVDWDTVGWIITRVMDDGLDPARLEDLFDIGVDEVSRRRHKYVTLVSDHRSGRVVWGAEGQGAATFDAFFGPDHGGLHLRLRRRREPI
jgi:transposase